MIAKLRRHASATTVLFLTWMSLSWFGGPTQLDTRLAAAVFQEDAAEDEDPLAEVLAGHSIHGDAFNEGPRQQAYLMGGTGSVDFPVSTTSESAQAFINQGVGQLHGFWYLEAERSFRQAAAIDPDCAMAYWGAGMAAYSDRDRARGFIEEALERIDGVTDREKLYIRALEKYFADDKKSKKDRAQELLKNLETIVLEHPDDLEAKAFVAHRIWHNGREGIPVSSYVAADALIQEILSREPLHPTHHFAIHLWDYRQPEKALVSAARCGPSAPSIAHMWHMPGHIYSRLNRYEDAVYQQEASARVDHAQMMRDHLMPDEINNFAHNNEWLIRNLVFLGQVRRAIDLAKNMVELPRHPTFNTLDKRGGSASYGRRRLIQVLQEFELHEQAIELCQTPYLVEPDNVTEQIKTLRLLACAAASTGTEQLAQSSRGQLEQLQSSTQQDRDELDQRIAKLEQAVKPDADDSESDVDPKKAKVNLSRLKKERGELDSQLKQVEKALLAVEGYASAANQDYETGFERLKKAGGEDDSLIAEWQFQSGATDQGIEALKQQVEKRPGEVIPLARLAFAYHQNGDVELAETTFEQLRDASSYLDIDLPLFTRLAPIAAGLDLPEDWRKPYQPASDLGYRPPLDSLGPFRWSPQPAPQWSLKDSLNVTTGSADYAGRPHILIFYLGHGCLHCAEQLQAFAPRVDDFAEAGIELVAISTDNEQDLLKSVEDAGGPELGIRLTANGDLSVFKKFRAFDDFENQPLHGTFLIDADGQVRWQDISYQPFMDHAFLLREAQRLLAEETSKAGP